MKTVFTFFFAVILLVSHAQVLNTIKYDTTNSGLPDNDIWDMEITSNDVLWLRDWGHGLVSFDGTTWTEYNASTANFPGNNINDLIIDNNNNVYVAGGFSVAKFNGTSWTDISPGNGFAEALAKDAAGNIWLANNGLQKYDGSNWSTLIPGPAGSNYWPQEMLVAPNNDIWVTSIGDAYVTKYDQGTTNWTVYDTSNVPLFDKQWWYNDIEITHDNKIIISATGDSTLYFNGTSWGVLDQLSGLSMSVVKDVIVKNNVSWFGMCNGFGLASYNGTTWKNYTTNPAYIPITGIRFDSQGYLWMSAIDGLYKVNANNLDVNDLNSLNDVALLYPSPSDGLMTLKFISANFKKAEAIVFDLSGKQVYVSDLLPAENNLDLTHLPAGVYTLNMKTDNGSYFQKIVLY